MQKKKLAISSFLKHTLLQYGKPGVERNNTFVQRVITYRVNTNARASAMPIKYIQYSTSNVRKQIGKGAGSFDPSRTLARAANV